MTYNFLVEIRQRTKPVHNMIILIVGLIVSNLTTLAIIVWSIEEPDIRQGWKKVFQKIKESRATQYNSDNIQAFFRQYFELIDDVDECTNLHDWKRLHVEIEAFERVYNNKIPETLLETKTINLLKLHNQKYLEVSA